MMRPALEILGEVLEELDREQLVQLQDGGVALILLECPIDRDDCRSKTIVVPRRALKEALKPFKPSLRAAVKREIGSGQNIILFDDRGESMTFASTRCYYFPGGKSVSA